MSTSSKS
ncbi:hypothetical protein D029_2126A, partial [Vibrio parahaemolyticus 970107]